MSAVVVAVLALRTVLLVVLVILAVLVLLLCLPVAAEVIWDAGKLTVNAKVLCFRVMLWPRKPKKEEKPKPKKGQNAAEKQVYHAKAEEEEKGISARLKTAFKTNPLEKVSHILEYAGNAASKLMKGIHIRHLNLYWPVTGEDAAETALNYGRAMAVLSGLMAVAENKLDIRTDKIWIEPDYLNNLAEKQHFSCQIHTHLFIIVSVGLYLGKKVLTDPMLRV